jgi:hypothetical protein
MSTTPPTPARPTFSSETPPCRSIPPVTNPAPAFVEPAGQSARLRVAVEFHDLLTPSCFRRTFLFWSDTQPLLLDSAARPALSLRPLFPLLMKGTGRPHFYPSPPCREWHGGLGVSRLPTIGTCLSTIYQSISEPIRPGRAEDRHAGP